jgi:hypothetical protein
MPQGTHHNAFSELYSIIHIVNSATLVLNMVVGVLKSRIVSRTKLATRTARQYQ